MHIILLLFLKNFLFLRQDNDLNSISINSRMLWDAKTSKISQNTKITEFSSLIENKYGVKIGKTLNLFSLSKLYFLLI